MARAGEEQEELLEVQKSSVGDVACSMLMDTVPHVAKSVHMRWGAREVAEEDAGEGQFCIDSIIQDTKKPRTVNFRNRETDVPFKIDTGAYISVMDEKTFLQLWRKPHLSPKKVQLASHGVRLAIKDEVFGKTCVRQKTFKLREVVVRSRDSSNLLSRTVVEKWDLSNALKKSAKVCLALQDS